MKSEMRKKPIDDDKKYPVLMKSKTSGMVVLFIKPASGFVVLPGSGASTVDLYGDGNYKSSIGDFSDHWSIDDFVPLEIGSQIIITQDFE